MGEAIAFNNETCNHCNLCAEVCPVRAICKDGRAGVTICPERMQFCMKCGHCMAVCPSQSITVDGLSYERHFFEIPPGPVAEMPFLEMIKSRRAIRTFKDRPVPKELLEKIVHAIAFAPPGFTPHKTEIVVVQQKAVVRRALAEMIKVYSALVKAMKNPIARRIVRCKVGRSDYGTLTRHVIPLMEMRLPDLQRGVDDSITRNAPAMILFHANLDTDGYETDIHIALTYGFLAAHALGLGASAISLIPPAVQNSIVLRRLFSIPNDNVVVSAMIVGFPKFRYQRGIRRRLKSVTWI